MDEGDIAAPAANKAVDDDSSVTSASFPAEPAAGFDVDPGASQVGNAVTDTDTAAIAHYYDSAESVELMAGVRGWLGLARLRSELLAALPPAPAEIADIGGGTGILAYWLAGRGYRVALSDLSPEQVHAAREREREIPLADCVVADARALPWPDSHFDAVLMLGPLYHLLAEHERVEALKEAARVTRPGGLVFAEGLSRSSLLPNLLRRPDADMEMLTALLPATSDGVFKTTPQTPTWFVDAFFHEPEQLGDEITTAGLDLVDLFALEGPPWLAAPQGLHQSDPARAQLFMEVSRRLSRHREALALTPHMIAIGRVRDVAGRAGDDEAYE